MGSKEEAARLRREAARNRETAARLKREANRAYQLYAAALNRQDAPTIDRYGRENTEKSREAQNLERDARQAEVDARKVEADAERAERESRSRRKNEEAAAQKEAAKKRREAAENRRRTRAEESTHREEMADLRRAVHDQRSRDYEFVEADESDDESLFDEDDSSETSDEEAWATHEEEGESDFLEEAFAGVGVSGAGYAPRRDASKPRRSRLAATLLRGLLVLVLVLVGLWICLVFFMVGDESPSRLVLSNPMPETTEAAAEVVQPFDPRVGPPFMSKRSTLLFHRSAEFEQAFLWHAPGGPVQLATVRAGNTSVEIQWVAQNPEGPTAPITIVAFHYSWPGSVVIRAIERTDRRVLLRFENRPDDPAAPAVERVVALDWDSSNRLPRVVASWEGSPVVFHQGGAAPAWVMAGRWPGPTKGEPQ